VLGDRQGAIVAPDPATVQFCAMVSRPALTQTFLSKRITTAQWWISAKTIPLLIAPAGFPLVHSKLLQLPPVTESGKFPQYYNLRFTPLTSAVLILVSENQLDLTIGICGVR